MLIDIQTLAATDWIQSDTALRAMEWLGGLAAGALVWRYVRPPKLGYLQAVRLKPQETPHDVHAYFDSKDDELHRAGFAPAGDYQTVHGKTPNYARFYSCRAGDVFVEVNVYRNLSGVIRKKDCKCVSCATVFEDGTCLQTGDIYLADGGAQAPPQLILRGYPKLNCEQLIAAHRRHVAELVAQHGPVLCYPADQLADVSVYYTQYQREYFFNRGELPAPDGFEQTKTYVDIPAEKNTTPPKVNV